MTNISPEKANKIQQKWKFWDTELKSLWDKKITSGPRYSKVFFKTQTMDCCIRKLDTGSFIDSKWSEVNKKLSRSDRRKAEKHQSKLVKSAENVFNSI